jgi:hypothetical protein
MAYFTVIILYVVVSIIGQNVSRNNNKCKEKIENKKPLDCQ